MSASQLDVAEHFDSSMLDQKTGVLTSDGNAQRRPSVKLFYKPPGHLNDSIHCPHEGHIFLSGSVSLRSMASKTDVCHTKTLFFGSDN